MRVLPYFQSVQLKRPSSAAARKFAEAAPVPKDAVNARPSRAAAAKDEFIPSDKLARVTHPARKESHALNNSGGELKEKSNSEPVQNAAATDEFIPAIPVTGVVHSIRSDPGIEEKSSGVLKSGNYSIYKLNGIIEKPLVISKGEKLDLKG